jgi:two-component system OmpR family sensor kinase
MGRPRRRRLPARSLRAQLVLTVTAVAVVALVAADLLTYASLRTVLFGQVDSTLQSSHRAIEATLTGRPFPPGGAGNHAESQGGPGAGAAPAQGGGDDRSGSSPAGGTPAAPPTGMEFCARSAQSGDAPGAYVEVRRPVGAIVDGDRCPAYVAGATAYTPKLPSTITGFHREAHGPDLVSFFDAPASQAGGPQFRVRAELLPAGKLAGDQLVLALPLTNTQNTLNGLAVIELAVTAGALAAALALGWWLVYRELLPLRRMETTAESIAGGRFDVRVPGEDAAVEVGRVASALNAMLDAIEEAFAERDATERQLRASEERLRRFVGDASHELRTPIAAVSAYAELFERSSGHEEDVPRIMHGIRVETARMARLVDDLLLLARLDEHRPLREEPVELVDVAAHAVETARTVGPAWPVRLEADGTAEVLGDEVQLRQVLDNLLANVRAHTPPGTAATVRVRNERGSAVLEVSDEGPGLGADDAARVFERFYRADASRARSSGGAGLGLAIVRAVAEAHGGSVFLSSQPGSGATFGIRLPCPRGGPGPGSAAPAGTAADGPQPGGDTAQRPAAEERS